MGGPREGRPPSPRPVRDDEEVRLLARRAHRPGDGRCTERAGRSGGRAAGGISELTQFRRWSDDYHPGLGMEAGHQAPGRVVWRKRRQRSERLRPGVNADRRRPIHRKHLEPTAFQLPAQPCPCVVLVTGPNGGTVNKIPVTVIGAPTGPIPPVSTVADLQVQSVRVTGGLTLASAFGGAAGADGLRGDLQPGQCCGHARANGSVGQRK